MGAGPAQELVSGLYRRFIAAIRSSGNVDNCPHHPATLTPYNACGMLSCHISVGIRPDDGYGHGLRSPATDNVDVGKMVPSLRGSSPLLLAQCREERGGGRPPPRSQRKDGGCRITSLNPQPDVSDKAPPSGGRPPPDKDGGCRITSLNPQPDVSDKAPPKV